MITYKLHCDGPGCRRFFDGAGKLKMPHGWSEFRGQVTISNGDHVPPTHKEIEKHYCEECRERLADYGVAPAETIVMGPDLLPSTDTHCECGFRWPIRSKHAACPNCGRLRVKPRKMRGGSGDEVS